MTEKYSNALDLRSLPEGKTVVFKSILVVKKIDVRIAKNGSEFLKIEVGDKTSSFGFTCFESSATFNLFRECDVGTIIFLEGMNRHYNGAFSPDILSARELTEREIAEGDWENRLTMVSEESVDILFEELKGYIAMISNEKLRNTVRDVLSELDDDFIHSVAAKTMHHAYKNGLLEHTVHVTRSGTALLKFYPNIPVDLALAGMILHDVGKVAEYIGDMAIERTKIGILQGHVVLGYRLVRRFGLKNELEPELLERLEHIILSHQGRPEYGAVTMPSTPEAVFVSLVDNFDAKMGMVSHLLKTTPSNQIFSEKFPGLETQLLIEPVNL
ncbi:MAG: HD domain-containing protein [Puniceicoccales bacterium]|jgi:3'-5' exoribonuclease|nr:HD domain-containing protein [Puniceicoccales bacterium]